MVDAVGANNANAGGSYIPQGQYALTVRGIGLLQKPRDIEHIVVAAQKGTPVRVGDIGRVEIGHAIRLGYLGRDHEDDLVQGIVLMRKDENPGRVIDAVKARLPEIQKLLPADVDAFFVQFTQAHPRLSPTQIRFLDLLKNHIARYGLIEVEKLWEIPFTTLNSDGLSGIFPEPEQDEILHIIKQINLEVAP